LPDGLQEVIKEFQDSDGLIFYEGLARFLVEGVIDEMAATYETYETDADYDTMTDANTAELRRDTMTDANSTEARHNVPIPNSTQTRAPEAVPPVVKIENKSGNNKKVKIILCLTTVVVLLLLGVIALLLKSNFEEKGHVDCDVGPWGAWTSCYAPPGTCGIGSKNRTREEIAEAQNNGERCAKSRLIELAEFLDCNVPCNASATATEISHVDCDVGPWGAWTSCYAPPGTCGIGSKNRTREEIAEAQNNGEKCAKFRLIELAEFLVCNVACPVDCKVGLWTSWTSCSATCGEGNKERTREKIAEAENNGTQCVSSRNFIPLKQTHRCNNGFCPSDGWSTFGDHRYLYMNNSGSRYNDIEVCRSECSSFGGSLASIHSKEENDFVFNLIQPHNDGGVYGHTWFGATCVNGAYTWDDGTPWDYQNWNSGYDNSCSRSCVFLGYDKGNRSPDKWTQGVCSYSKEFDCICKI